MFFKKKINDQYQVGWNQELMGAQEGKEKNDLIVAFTYMTFQVIKDSEVKVSFMQNEDPAGNKNEGYKGTDKQGQYNAHFYR